MLLSDHVESFHQDVLDLGVDLRQPLARVPGLAGNLGQDQRHVLRLLELGHLGRVLAQRPQDRLLVKK